MVTFTGYCWYGGASKGPGRPPKWVDRLLSTRPARGQSSGNLTDNLQNAVAEPGSVVSGLPQCGLSGDASVDSDGAAPDTSSPQREVVVFSTEKPGIVDQTSDPSGS